MSLTEIVDAGHEQVSYFVDDETGLRAIVGIHDTHLGPGLGGTRFYDYESDEAALQDVLRLSSAMTYKAAAADLPFGGGKAVIVGDPETMKSEALLEAYGRAIETLGGRYVASVDMNTTIEDMDVVARETDYVAGTSDGLGDPSPITARGALASIETCAEHVYGDASLADLDVLVQGIGKVGRSLAADLIERGAAVTVSDVDDVAVDRFVGETGAEAIAPEAVYGEPCDVFVPCAIGGVVNDETLPELSCDIVVGVANNVLEERRHAAALQERGILYAPDYVVNAGGLITVAKEYLGGTREGAYEDAEAIGDRLRTMIERAESRGTTVLEAADAYVEARISDADTIPPIPPESVSDLPSG